MWRRWRDAHRRWHESHGRWRGAHKRWRHSIRWRLVTLFLVLALATSGVFLFGMQRVLKTGWQNWARPLVADFVDRLAADLGTPPDPARARALAERLPITLVIEGPRVHYDTRVALGQAAASRRWSDHDRAAEDWGFVRTTADGHRITFGLAALAEHERARRVGGLTLAALLALTAVAYLVVHRLLVPLRAIGDGAARFGRGEFDTPIAVQRRDELGDLAERVNGMASSLRGMLDAKRALLLAISHELRSPLTRARLNAELVDDGEAKAALLRDLAEMGELISSLLESERIAAGHRALQIEPVSLPALAREVVAAHFAGQAVEFDLDEGLAAVAADATRLKLLLRNLIDNALRHGAGGAPPRLLLRREADGRVALGVRDFGAGVADEHLVRLSEAFYRPDTARTRDRGGVGLGLYLCRLVAMAHGGELRFTRAEPGLEVAMVWSPAAPGQAASRDSTSRT